MHSAADASRPRAQCRGFSLTGDLERYEMGIDSNWTGVAKKSEDDEPA
jgi:hypothetical protein